MREKEKGMLRIDEQIRKIKRAAEELAGSFEDFPAVTCNARRILASAKMLEIEVSDIVNML